MHVKLHKSANEKECKLHRVQMKKTNAPGSTRETATGRQLSKGSALSCVVLMLLCLLSTPAGLV